MKSEPRPITRHTSHEFGDRLVVVNQVMRSLLPVESAVFRASIPTLW